jgi:hypothetical protein
MLTRSMVLVVVLLLVALVILLYLFNPWVYAYKPESAFTIDVSTGRPIVVRVVECIGFTPYSTGVAGVRIIPGDFVCYSGRGESVFDSLRIYINASIGYWVYSDVALFYANSTSVKYVDVIVEKPLNMTGLEVILRGSSGNTVLVVDATSYNKYELSLPQGESVYRVTIVLNSDKPTRGVFRIGFYIKNT